MKTLNRTSRYALVLAACALASICAIGVSALQQRRERETPKVISKVKHLEAVGTILVREGEPTEALAITIRNNSNSPVVAVTVESGDEKDTAGVSVDGFGHGDVPASIILEPYGTFTMEVPAANSMIATRPVRTRPAHG